MALDRLGVPYEHWRLSEWDVATTKSYKAIHFPDDNKDYSKGKSKEELIELLDKIGISSDGKTPMSSQKIARKGEKWLRTTFNDFMATKNIGSITNRNARSLGIENTSDYCYILTYSFPCQDISSSGKQLGMSKGSGTRSGLLWQVERLLNEAKELPQVLIMENVNAIHNKKNISDFQKWLDFLKEKGYSTYWQDLNAKDYGVPQNRVRTFAISILGNYEYKFPKPIKLKTRLKDILEDEVDENFYVNNEKTEKLISDLIGRDILPSDKQGIVLSKQATEFEKLTDVAGTLMARDWKGFGNQQMCGVIESNE